MNWWGPEHPGYCCYYCGVCYHRSPFLLHKMFFVPRSSGTNSPPRRKRSLVPKSPHLFPLAVCRWNVCLVSLNQWPIPWRSVHRMVTGKGHLLYPISNHYFFYFFFPPQVWRASCSLTWTWNTGLTSGSFSKNFTSFLQGLLWALPERCSQSTGRNQSAKAIWYSYMFNFFLHEVGTSFYYFLYTYCYNTSFSMLMLLNTFHFIPSMSCKDRPHWT